jgi:hypothetical protein
MKPIIKQTEQDVILTSEITEQHIVVATTTALNHPVILTKPYDTDMPYRFVSLESLFTIGNFISEVEYGTIKSCVDAAINKNWNIAVFHQSEWHKALQWLIDNGKTK